MLLLFSFIIAFPKKRVMSASLCLDQARHYVGPDLSTDCENNQKKTLTVAILAMYSHSTPASYFIV